MTRILHVTSSTRGDSSYSNRLAARVLDRLRRSHPDAVVTVRDLARDPLPHIDADFVTAIRSPGPELSDSQKARVARSDALVDELLAADIVVIAAPMINFGIPSTLKAWIDHIARAGRTFSYREGGPVGLVTGKRVILIAARGGVYTDARRSADFQLPYLLGVLGFLGMSDVEVLDVDGTAGGPEVADRAVEAAATKLEDRCAAVAAR